MQRRAFAILHAVIRPERLPQAVKLALGIGLNLMLAGKAAVIRRVPVLAGNHRFASFQAPVDKPVGDVHRTVALRDGKCAAGAKIIL